MLGKKCEAKRSMSSMLSRRIITKCPGKKKTSREGETKDVGSIALRKTVVSILNMVSKGFRPMIFQRVQDGKTYVRSKYQR
jgi:hypothetical protein